MRKVLFYLLFISAFLGPAFSYHGIYLFHIAAAAWGLTYAATELRTAEQLQAVVGSIKTFWFIPALVGWYVISLLWCTDLTAGFVYILQLVMGLFTAVAIIVETGKTVSKKEVMTLAGAMVLVSIGLAWFEVVSPWRWPISNYSPLADLFGYPSHVPFDAFEESFIKITPTSFFYNPNNFGLVLAMAYPFVFKKEGWIAPLLIALIIATVFFASARIAMFAIGIEHLVLSVVYRKRISLVVSGFVMFAIIACYPQISERLNPNGSTPDFVVEKAKEFSPFEIPQKYIVIRPLQDNSVPVRSTLIKKGIGYFTGSYGLGVGAASSRVLLQQDGGVGRNMITNLHNFWLEVACEGGLIALGILAIGMLSILRSVRRNFTANAEDSILILTAIAGTFLAVMSLSTAIYFLPLYMFVAILLINVRSFESTGTR